jgi:hypothetical protein
MFEREQKKIPGWAKRERASDIEWIQENLHIFFPAARQAFEESGRGAIVTDTTIPPVEHAKGKGHPFVYFPQAVIEENKWEDVMRMVNEYDPAWELVCVLLKKNRESAYRIGVPAARPKK